MREANTTVNPATEAFGQARQGSVAAIIQVLNERLADIGIRTRAVVADGMLQLLCEAATAEQLQKEKVVDRVRSELETISPQRIKKVKINSRIVKEEQLLWLEEINRDPENNLLWAEVITLKRPFFVQRWIRDRDLKPAGPIFKDITEPEPAKTSFSSKLIGGASLAALLLAALWVFREDISPAPSTSSSPSAPTVTSTELAPTSPPNSTAVTPATTPSSRDQERSADTTPTPSAPATPPVSPSSQPTTPPANASATPSPPDSSNSGNVSDAFSEAVRVAEQAAIDGQTATTAAQWLDLAARWQKASDLMSNIPAGSEQYAVAQDRIATYKTNSQSALQEATALQSQR